MLVTVLLLVGSIGLMAVLLPDLVATVFDSARLQISGLAAAARAGDGSLGWSASCNFSCSPCRSSASG